MVEAGITPTTPTGTTTNPAGTNDGPHTTSHVGVPKEVAQHPSVTETRGSGGVQVQVRVTRKMILVNATPRPPSPL